MARKPSTCVVLCYWTGESSKNLFRLLDQMRRVDAGSPFDVVIVVNGGDVRPLTLPARFNSLNAKVVNRINRGYNIEAWDVGWRSHEDYEYYLFLQSECFLKRPGWVANFEFRMARDPGVGLLGECYTWEQKTWGFIREATDRDLGPAAWPEGAPMHPIDQIRAVLEQKGIPLTELGTHLQSIILFTSRKILLEINGFPLPSGATYYEAVASEVGLSRLIESKGYRLSRIQDRDLSMISHRQQTWSKQLEMKVRGKFKLRSRVKAMLKTIGISR